jgi:signal transduction histidine kinase
VRIWRRLGLRIVLVSAVVAIFTTFAVNLLLARMTLEVAAARAGQFLTYAGKGELGAQCRASPSTFHVVDDGFEMFALDAQLNAQLEGAPEIPERLLDRLRRGDAHASTFATQEQRTGGVMLQRVAAEGPCAVLAVRWGRSPEHILEGLQRIALLTAVAMLLAMTLGLLLVVRPLTGRIRELKEAASKVGGAEVYVPMTVPPADELDQVRHVLDEAHARIVKGAAALAKKNDALVSHLSDVAHDLRTPIAALQLKLERLGDDSLGGEEREEERLAALADALYLEALCENLRFAATLREGLAIESARSELGRAVLRVRDRLGVLARRRGVALEVAIPDDEVHAPVARVVAERVLGNLVANAIVHRDEEGGNVAVVLEAGPEGFVLRVIDDGPGLPDEVRERLIEASVEASPQWTETGGTGLGLRIVTALCQRSGLRLSWNTPDDGGLEVRIEGAVASPRG